MEAHGKNKRIVVVGGGITGLACAHRILELAQENRREIEVILLEASPSVGGIIQTEKRNGFLLERGPDSFISEKPEALELAKKLALNTHLIETNDQHRRSFIVSKGKLRPVPLGFHLLAPGRLLPFLRSDIFTWGGKARMAMDLFLPRARENGADESLGQFVRRRFGSEALERMAQPMVGGIYTADPEQLSLRATMPRFLEMEREHRSLILALKRQARKCVHPNDETSGARYGLFLSFDQGTQLLTDTLAKAISASSSLRLHTRVEALEINNQTSWSIRTNSNEALQADAVCLALPAHAAARLVRNLDESLAAELDEISYASSATINLGYKRADIPHPLDGFGFVVPFIEGRTIMACTFSSVKFAGRAPDNHELLRVFVGGALQPEVMELEETELLSRVLKDLRELLGIERAPIFAEVTRWEKAMPQFHLGHLDRMQRILSRCASLPGLALAGGIFHGPGIPDCIRSGQEAATILSSHLQH